MELFWLCSSFVLVPLPQHCHLVLHLALIYLQLNLVDLGLSLLASTACCTVTTAMRHIVFIRSVLELLKLLLEGVAALENFGNKECSQVFVCV